MKVIYFIHGVLVGAFRLLIGFVGVCYLHGKIAAESNVFVTDIDPVLLDDEIDRRLDDG